MASLTRGLPSCSPLIASDPCRAKLLRSSPPLIPAFTKPAKHAFLHSYRTHSPCVVKSQSIEVSDNEIATTPATSTSANIWDSFSAAASGEWDGVNVTFDRDGEAQQLPEYYVPQAYRDWQVEIYDWQSQCSMLADASGLKYTLRRLMPTVGCEADAVAFTEDLQAMFTPQGAAITPDGGYSTGPLEDLSSKDVFKAQSEHCFPLELPGQRIRIVHNLKRMGAEGIWKILSIELHRERRDGPHNGRRELAGCGGGMDPFASKPAVEISNIEGKWNIVDGVKYVAGNNGEMTVVDIEKSVDGDGDGGVLDFSSLPGVIGLRLNSWSAAQVVGDADVEIVAGVLLENGKMKAVKQSINNGKVSTIELMTLERSN